MKTVVFVVIFSAVTLPVAAQWLNHPTPGIPRTANGKPNLTAAAPRTADGKPDLSGIWQRISFKYERNVTADLKPGEIQPWAQKLAVERAEDLGKDHMSVQCLPFGPSANYSPRKAKIVQTPSLILFLDEDLTYRQIFMDGRPLEKEPNPSWTGYSVGRWDGDTLVVESFGFNDKTWLDRNGHPHSEALRTTERYRRRDFGHMDIQITLNDPAVYARPWTIALNADLVADTEMLESVCNESKKNLELWVGKASDEKKAEVKVAAEILAKYAGTYQEQDLWGNGPHPRMIQITTSDGALFGELTGRPNAQLTAQSENTFAGLNGWGIKFVTDGQGAVTHLLEMHISGDYRYRRVK
jgi:hypothetical protein